MVAYHRPVMLAEALAFLDLRPGERYADATLGTGGHAEAMLRAGARVLALDADPEAVAAARGRLQGYGESLTIVHASFGELVEAAEAHGYAPLQGVLFDLGLSSLQLDEEHRGFSFRRDEPLDMRLDPTTQEVTAADIVNSYPEGELARLLEEYGEERYSRRIARQIALARPLRTTGQLVAAVEAAVPGPRGRLHPATRVFQALRIVVNHELEILESGLEQAVDLLAAGGRVVVIAYHSLEDRIVKEFLRRESQDCLCPPGILVCQCGHRAALRLLTKKVVEPSAEEVRANPRSRSARLRAAARL
ncbi:MAG: 16S rRNA (cytosine(1402)-N(4))-methyltransferase RsmH [Chloroflexi bacterium]|nr:16S rRNA (cytosine(1402)-N(4))-methyltransferase RsmH [Chloroflexota bacterium]